MIHPAPSLLLALALAAPQEPQAVAPFPPSTALAERISPEGLSGLGELVQSLVDGGEIVGAELLVVVNGRTLLHEGYGWRDRDAKVPMEPGGVFCVRSMTKPLIGAATWMLIESGNLHLDDRAAEYLPAFDVEGQRDITVAQLLRHQSGLPMSLILGRDPRTLASLRAVADLGGDCELEFAPGTGFHYSDQGTDTLTALIEIVTGAPADVFVRERLLEPLGMRDSACVMSAGHPLRSRCCSAYAGSAGSWTRFWGPQEEPLFPIFLGSQALYSTASDYARFLQLFLERGRAGGKRLLRSSSVRHTLESGPWPVGGPTGFPGLRCDYGTLMQLWTADPGPESPVKEGEEAQRELVAFGHTGSDGTHAWAFPEQKAMVLFFTQSRGTLAGLRVEERLGDLLLGVPFDPLQAAPPLEEYLGYYWEGEGDLYRAIIRDGDELALEILGQAIVALDYLGQDRWRFRQQPGTVLVFDRDEAGLVTGYHIGDHREFRFTPRADLPAADEVLVRVQAAHHLERLAGAGVVRMRGRIELPKLARNGETSLWLAWPDRWRMDESLGDERGSVAFDGATLRMARPGRPVGPMEGPAAVPMLQGDPFVRFGQWKRDGAELVVVQELRRGDDHVMIVRAGDTSAPAPTLFVDWGSGRVRRMDCMTFLEGLGRIGQRVEFEDFRDVGGALLPWRIEVQLAHALIGTVLSTFDSVEVQVQVGDGLFELRE